MVHACSHQTHTHTDTHHPGSSGSNGFGERICRQHWDQLLLVPCKPEREKKCVVVLNPQSSGVTLQYKEPLCIGKYFTAWPQRWRRSSGFKKNPTHSLSISTPRKRHTSHSSLMNPISMETRPVVSPCHLTPEVCRTFLKMSSDGWSMWVEVKEWHLVPSGIHYRPRLEWRLSHGWSLVDIPIFSWLLAPEKRNITTKLTELAIARWIGIFY